MEVRMKMPDLATTGSDIRLVRWLAQPGQTIRRGQPLLEIETDKAVSQVESVATGVLKEVRVLPDSMVSAGQVIAVVDVTGPSQASAQEVPHPPISPPAAAAAGALPPADETRASTTIPRASAPLVSPAAYEPPCLLSLYQRMLLIR